MRDILDAAVLLCGDTLHWIAVRDGDDRARGLYLRHYSARRYRDGRPRRLFAGPGEKLVLLTAACDALVVWRKFLSDDGQAGVNCAVFRNEGRHLSSDLIREACWWAWQRWPGARLYTYVNPRRIRSTNPGYCFLMAGWRRCGVSQGGLVILERLPDGAAGGGTPRRAVQVEARIPRASAVGVSTEACRQSYEQRCAQPAPLRDRRDARL